jgi:P pilus assembly chaperone PapD
VTNGGDESTLIQLELVRCAMKNGKDRYAPAKHLLATPPIFNLTLGQSQIVCVGMRRPLAGPIERSYRLFLSKPPMQRRDMGEVVGLHSAMGLPERRCCFTGWQRTQTHRSE